MSRKSLFEISDRRRRDRLGPRIIGPFENFSGNVNVHNQDNSRREQSEAIDEAVHVELHGNQENDFDHDQLNEMEHEEIINIDLDNRFNLEDNNDTEHENLDSESYESESDEYEERIRLAFDEENNLTDSDENTNAEVQENDHIRRELINLRSRQLVYRGAPLTVGDSMLVILTILLQFDVSYLCLARVIGAINLHCSLDQLKKNSLFKFQQYFALNETQDELKKHHYCSTCLGPLHTEHHICPSCPHRKNKYFIELPFFDQLKEMFQRRNFYNDLQWRFRRPQPLPGYFTDIYDGSLYNEWHNNGFLENPNNISFSWFTDGVPIFKSSKISLWPLYLRINELPFNMRVKKENTILAGLWFGDKKPHANHLIYVFRPAFLELYEEGIEVSLPLNNRTIVVKGILLSGTCDLPAKSQFLNLTQFNGAYGYPRCFFEGRSIPIEPRSSVHVFENVNNPVLRTSLHCEVIAQYATPENPILGIKGPCAFSTIMPDFIGGMGIDKMHGVDGGIVKKILILLFSDKYSKFPFSLYGVINVIDRRLTAIKPPKYVHRMPRTVNDLLHWKSSELRLWFLYYSIPIFNGILRQDLFNHYILLVVAISLLDSESLSSIAIIIAKDLLHTFVRRFQILYGPRFCSINVHQLLHLIECVERLGPLWVYSCYEFENLNGQFLKLVHGTWHIDTQIAKSHSQFIKMIRLIEELPEGPILDFCLDNKQQVKLNEMIFKKCYSVGTYKIFDEVPDFIYHAMAAENIYHYNSLLQYFRLLKDGQLYVATEYRRDLQTESHIVKYYNDEEYKFGSVRCFVKIIGNCNCESRNCECNTTHVAILQKIRPETVFVALGDNVNCTTEEFLFKSRLSESIKAVNIIDLQCVCVKMMVDDEMFIGIPINRTELE